MAWSIVNYSNREKGERDHWTDSVVLKGSTPSKEPRALRAGYDEG